MRGKVKMDPLTIMSMGITPAYAGKSDFFENFGAVLWDHPRVCGEKCINILS